MKYFVRRLQRKLTTKKGLQAKQFDLCLPLNRIWRGGTWRTGAGPIHLALAQTHGVDIVAAHLQDQTSVHHVQQAVGEESLLVVGDVLCGGEAQLFQADRSEQLLLVDHGSEVAVEEPATLRVADGEGRTHLPPSVQELHLQVGH